MANKTQALTQKIFSTLIIAFTLIMVFGSLEVSRAANTANSELYQNITAGSLDIAAQNTNISFGNIAAGLLQNAAINMNNVLVTDYRGTGAGWSATTGSIENYVDVTDSNKQITLNNALKWSPGDVENVNGSSITGVTAGTDDVYLNTTRNLMVATASNGLGAYRISNTVLNFTQQPSYQAGNYSATLTLTVS
ncbi:MAG: hypothetical protein WC497_05095 [Patescibacteria group bacterium]